MSIQNYPAPRSLRLSALRSTLAFAALALGAFTTLSLTAAPLGTAFTYQGRLDQSGQPANGNYIMRFALYDAPAPGGNAVGGPNQLPVAVANGLFTADLDFGPTAFAGDARWLEIAVSNDNGGTFTTLLPRTRLAPAPGAIFASTAANVAGGGVAATGLATTSGPSAGQVLGYNGSSLVWQNPGGLALPFDQSQSLAGNSLFGVNNTASGSGITGDSQGGSGVFGRSQSGSGVFGVTFANASYGVLGRNDSPAGTGGSGVFGVASSGAVGVLGVSDGNDGVSGRSNAEGKSGVFGYSEKNSGHGGSFVNTADGIGLTGSSLNGTGTEGLSTGGWGVYGHSQGNTAVVGVSEGHDGVSGRSNADGKSGVFGYTERANGNAVSGLARGASVGVRGESDGNDGVVGTSNADGKSGVFGYTSHSTGWGGFFMNTGGGTALHAEGNAFVSRDMSVRTCTIRGGADLAEPFLMKEETIEKGSVVVIDEDHPGQLKLSARAYDTRVAGIVSGANGINPGIALKQEGALDQGQNVALTGRVYVKADASHGAIKPGDLLTTSDNPGHAMKVGDHPRAQGAILGKAMSALKEGTGLVLVLVTLQ